ncbi:MAG: 23S rRNA (pseudouridine(1915)-N(3))-methyltransferase RlmH [Deltaproteobacteria bacterium]|nr:MAG: 23S rRNA (pseudouridine(1915)-N(3))-methyltransferase RlmH [Deltaproteobacteria bacterium]
MKIRLLSVGRDKSGLFAPAVELYAERIRRHLPFELLELPPSRHRSPERARAEEGERILAATEGRRRVALDERGRALGSVDFARRLERWMLERQDVDFIVGGDEGLDPRVREAADAVLSLGPMTLPHRLARVVVAEQIYRALSILAGTPYHK